MKREWGVFLQDMIHAGEKIVAKISGLTLDEFLSDEWTRDATVANLLIMGEAAKKIPLEIKEKYPQIPWKGMAGLRDITVHNYWGIDYREIYALATKYLLVDLENLRKIEIPAKGEGI